ncbi:MAG: FTR1 family protein, partial [Alicyclobacillus shizuokensis]|nr:FTR1 family protein [Alicyclobacillus shizuokensis]
MLRRMIAATAVCFGLGLLSGGATAWAATQGQTDVKAMQGYLKQAVSQAQAGHLDAAKQSYEKFNDRWLQMETHVQSDSGQAYTDIEANMGQVEYAFMEGQKGAVIQALQQLEKTDAKYIDGGYGDSGGFQKQDITLSDFLSLLKTTRADIASHHLQQAQADTAQVRQSWLSVEGSVVAQSSTVYNDSERDMVVLDAMVHKNPPDYKGAEALAEKMIGYLSPLAQNSGYTAWDAAMIPIREGLEALLVVAALLAFVGKAGQSEAGLARRGRAWIWSGVGGGLVMSALLAVAVKLVFSSGAFGDNNFLISGWSGVIAAAMLLYVSYWLHGKSNIAEWNRYIRRQSQAALSNGRLISLGLLAFLAVFREGTETVLFIVGVASQIPLHSLVVGLLGGLLVLVVIAWLMLFFGVKLPLRPFFLVSSLIVFYLCFKFTGMGLH